MANPATMNALNVATDTVYSNSRKFSVGLYSAASFVGTVSLQRRRSGGTWRTIKTYTAEAEETGDMPGAYEVRLIVTAFTSGSIIGEVSA